MLRKLSFCLPMIAVALCLLAGAAFANDACSPTNPNAKTAIVQIPEVGTPNTPAGGVADGWVLLYKDSSFTQLTHEVYCRNNKIEFASSVGQANFKANPDCEQVACTRVAATGKLHQAALKSDSGNANRFIFAAKKNAFGLTGFTTLFTFPSSGAGYLTDGWLNESPVVQDANGNLYATTVWGGNGPQSGPGRAAGTVYEISPVSGGGAAETVLHTFFSGSTTDGWEPQGGVTFDASGNLWGQAHGGANSAGVIYKLTPGSGGTWNESVALSFPGNGVMGSGSSGLTLNPATGGLYGTGFGGSAGFGSIWSFNGKTVTDVYDSPGQSDPGQLNGISSLGIDGSGNLYGTTVIGGPFTSGLVYQVNPSTGVETTLYDFDGGLADGCDPQSFPTVDAAGNIYGTTSSCFVYNGGGLWKLTPKSGGGYTYTQLYGFCWPNGPKCTDGQSPYGEVVLDVFGNIYGTTEYGGDATCGTPSGDSYGGCGVLYMS